MKINIFYRTIFAVLLAVLTANLFADDIPQRPVPQRLVNDFAGQFTSAQIDRLESKLVAFDDSTSIQIAVVTVNSLYGYDKAMLAYEIGQCWGVGDARFDNGIVILFKPKTQDSKGEVFIATGYGLEGDVPDAYAKRIVENIMIPYFKKRQIYQGINEGVNALISLTHGSYTADKKGKKPEEIASRIFPVIIFFFFFIIFIITGISRSRRYYSPGRNIPFWIALMMLGGSSGRRSGGGFGNFSSGGGSFGGFGGGGFGGGGAGGSW